MFTALLLRCQSAGCAAGVEIRGTLVAGVENAVYGVGECQIKVCVGEMLTAAADF